MIFTSIRALSLCHLILVYNYNWMHSVYWNQGVIYSTIRSFQWPFCLVGFSLCCLVFQALLGLLLAQKWIIYTNQKYNCTKPYVKDQEYMWIVESNFCVKFLPHWCWCNWKYHKFAGACIPVVCVLQQSILCLKSKIGSVMSVVWKIKIWLSNER